MEDLTAAVCRVITYVCSRLESASGSDESNIVDRVLAHINQNYNKDISLKELAENVFFMNHTYLSHLIREKTGKTTAAICASCASAMRASCSAIQTCLLQTWRAFQATTIPRSLSRCLKRKSA